MVAENSEYLPIRKLPQKKDSAITHLGDLRNVDRLAEEPKKTFNFLLNAALEDGYSEYPEMKKALKKVRGNRVVEAQEILLQIGKGVRSICSEYIGEEMGYIEGYKGKIKNLIFYSDDIEESTKDALSEAQTLEEVRTYNLPSALQSVISRVPDLILEGEHCEDFFPRLAQIFEKIGLEAPDGYTSVEWARFLSGPALIKQAINHESPWLELGVSDAGIAGASFEINQKNGNVGFTTDDWIVDSLREDTRWDSGQLEYTGKMLKTLMPFEGEPNYDYLRAA